MNTIWSKYVQGINTLYFTRKLRFDDMFAAQYKALFALDELNDAPFLAGHSTLSIYSLCLLQIMRVSH